MVESSAKALHQSAAVVRQRHGSRVELINTACALPSSGRWFDHSAWSAAEPVGSGRGSNWYVSEAHEDYVLRHFQRGGAVARVLGDKYWFGSEPATRSFAEFHLLLKMREQALPVPEPVAAAYLKAGPWYTAELLTRRIPKAQSWSARLSSVDLSEHPWERIGRTIARLHGASIDHADLNAHNILIDHRHDVHVIDFDRGVERDGSSTGWAQGNLIRLRRSLNKLHGGKPGDIDTGWRRLLDGYQSFDADSD